MKSFKLLLAAVFALTVLTIPAMPSTAAPPVPVPEEPQNISGDTDAKLPSVAVGNGQVHVAWSEGAGAQYVARPEDATGAFPGSETRGSVGGNSTYFNAAVAVGSDGTIHYAWINGGSTIYYSNKRPGQGWSSQQLVTQFEDFANSLALTVKGSSEIFISWRHQGDNPNGYIRFAYSNNGGASWPVVKDVPTPTGTYAGKPYLAAGPNNGPVFLAWTGTDGSVYAGQWNGDNFVTVCVSCARYGTPNDFFNPTIAVGPTGRPYIAWRSVGRGVFYGSRQDDGTWGLSNQFGHAEVAGSVAIGVDSRSNIHLAWISKESGSFDTWYAVKASSEGDFSTPIKVSVGDGGFKANVDMAVSAKNGFVFAHLAWESFTNGQFIRYTRVRTPGIGCSATSAAETDEKTFAQPAIIYQNPVYFPIITKPVVPPPTC